LYFVQKVVGVFVRFRAPFNQRCCYCRLSLMAYAEPLRRTPGECRKLSTCGGIAGTRARKRPQVVLHRLAVLLRHRRTGPLLLLLAEA
jgi:hypothetical protein